MNIAVFCSGNGSNFQAIVDALKKGLFKAGVVLMVCDNPKAYAIKRAEKEGIKTLIVERQDFPSKEKFEERIIQELEKGKIELICLAGYMRMLSPSFVKKYKDRILNIHPAILPSFKGTQAIKDALDYGVKVTGVTVHFVNEDMDAGPIILQEEVKINPDETEESLAEKIHNIEHRLYPEAIRLFTEEKLERIGRKVRILAAVAVFFLVLGFDPKAMFGRELNSSLLPVQEAILYKEALPALPPETKAVLPKVRPLPSPQKEEASAATQKDNRAADEALKQKLTAYDKLELAILPPYDIANYTNSNHTQLLNPNLEIERPLTREEIEKMRIEGSFKVARAVAEAMDSIEARPAYQGINSLINIAAKIVSFRNLIRNKYHLYFRFDRDQALLRYKRRF